MASDKKTIGITAENASLLAELASEGHFISELDAAKFAMAFAIRQEMPAGTADGTDTKWNVGSVDPDGKLRSMIEALYPDTTEPYRLIEHLMNKGLEAISDSDEGVIGVYEMLFPAKST